MKQFVLKTATWIFLLLFFVGCESKEIAPVIPHELKCSVVMEHQGKQYEGTLHRPILGTYHFTVLSPDSVKGLEITLQNGVVAYAFESMEYTTDASNDKSLAIRAAKILEQITRNENITWVKEKETWSGQGACDGVLFKIVLEQKTNRPMSLETQDGVKMRFS